MMEIRPFCVYNNTNESFLSLDVTLAGGARAWFESWMGRSTKADSEGRWMTRAGRIRTLGLGASRDLLYLDHSLTVLAIVEDLPALRFAPQNPNAVSILELPAHSAASSETRIGHQLVICAADEMETRLRNVTQQDEAEQRLTGRRLGLRERFAEVRRATRRVRWPHLVAYEHSPESGSKTHEKVHEVKDISAGGLYLMTAERWPIGAQVRMTLQRAEGMAGPDDYTIPPVVVQLRVTRWGTDGMGLQFTQVGAEQTALVAMHVR